eukprot:3915540-Pyramimonas_sp.AAC.1
MLVVCGIPSSSLSGRCSNGCVPALRIRADERGRADALVGFGFDRGTRRCGATVCGLWEWCSM